MKSLFLVTHSVKIDREQVINYLSSQKGFGTWFYSMPSSFFIYSALSAENIGTLIQHRFGEQERVFVIKVTGASYYGWMPKDHWVIIENQGAERRFDLVFNGFTREFLSLPAKAGIFCVYRGKYNPSTDKVILYEVLYIGKGIDIRQESGVEKRICVWQQFLNVGEELWFSYAEVVQADMARCSAALIFLNKPRCNNEGEKNSFGYYDTLVTATGATVLLKTGFVETTK